MESKNEVMELSAQELDSVAGGAIRADVAKVDNLKDSQISVLTATREGITSLNAQSTDDFSAYVAEFNQTGNIL
ncbi:MAG: hypothetical protein OHK0047_39620 [Leptolyngbyaceae cyanobacterium]